MFSVDKQLLWLKKLENYRDKTVLDYCNYLVFYQALRLQAAWFRSHELFNNRGLRMEGYYVD